MTISNDAKRMVTLGEIGDLLTEFFDGEFVSQPTPYIWWHRSKVNTDISLPMPQPNMMLGRAGAERPLWTQEALLHWYGAWRGIDVPRGRPAGDRVDTRGHEVPSEYRAR